MTTYTMNDLAHPEILETAMKLAWKQVRLGFCRSQDQEDYAQDLMLYLSKELRRFKGKIPLVSWACELLIDYIADINGRLLGVPSYATKAKRAETTQATTAANPSPTPNPETLAPIPFAEHRPNENQEPACAASPISPSKAENPANGQSRQEKTSASVREENRQGAQGAQDSSVWGDPAKKPGVGAVRKLLQGFWKRLSSWVQGPPRDRAREQQDTKPKDRRDSC